MATKRTIDAAAIEQRLLDLAYTTDLTITAPALAYFAACSIDDAAAVLEDLAARDRLRMNIHDDGAVDYELPGRQKLLHAVPVERPRHPLAAHPHGSSPAVATLLGLFIPGAGHLYAGRVGAGVAWFVIVAIGYALILPGLLLHAMSVVSASRALPPPPRRPLLAA